MKVTILGCYGGQLPGKRMTSFLIGDSLLVDAGGATAGLDMSGQNAITDILVSHNHMDHIKDIPFLADNVIGMKPEPVNVVSTESIVTELKNHVMNNSIWPDFTMIPSKDEPVLGYRIEKPETRFEIGDVSVELVEVNHPVPTYAMFLTQGGKTLLYSADTGPTDRVWERARDYDNLAAVILETSFPNRLAELSLISGHLSPCHLPDELGKLGRDDIPVYLYHFKPAFEDDLNQEVAELGKGNLRPLVQGETLEL